MRRRPLPALLSADYAARRRALVGSVASPGLRPGRPGGAEPRLPGYAAGVTAELAVTDGWAGDPVTDLTRPGLASAPHGRDTCHVDAADRFGNLVTATPSGGWLQSSPVIPGLGVLPRHPGADVHPHPRAGEHAGAGLAPAHHPVPDAGAARR